MISLKESLLSDIDTTLARGKDDLDKAMGIPTLGDFYIPRFRHEYSMVIWRCQDKLEKYSNARWMPDNCPGITFMIYPGEKGDNVFYIECCFTSTLQYMSAAGYYSAPPLYNKRIYMWRTVLKDKNRLYCKKVVLSLIRHLSENPKAFNEFMHYIAEYVNHKSAEQSYISGTQMHIRDLMELNKIKG